MLKYVLLLVIVVIVWQLLLKRARKRREAAPQEQPMQEMVQCGHCGVYLPKAESVGDDERRYCSEAHRLADRSPQ